MPRTNAKIFKNCYDKYLKKGKADAVNKTIIIILISLCLCSPVFGEKTVVSKEDILSNLEKKYTGKSFVARFSQISRLAALDITEKAMGKAFFSHPGKMRWEYEEPETHQIITNGKLLWIYRPTENQVMTGDAAQFFKSGAGGAFLSDISLIRKNFEIRIKEIAKEYIELDLKSKKEITDIKSIVIRLSKKEYEITRVVTYNQFEDTTLFEFFDTRFTPIAPERFEFEVPEGVSAIDME